MVKNINRAIRTTLIVMIIFALLLILVKKVAEPAFSDLIAEPISDNIAKKASDYLEMPPTPESLVQFKEEALKEGWTDQKGQLKLEYRQLPDSTEGTITVSYSETFLTFMNLSASSDKVIYYQEPYEKELLVSTAGGEEQLRTASYEEDIETEQSEAISERTTLNTDQLSSSGWEEIPLEESTEEVKEEGSSQQTRQTEPDETEMNSSTSENGVALYVNGVYFDAFVSKKDALQLAAFVEDATIIDLVTNRVVWESK